MKERISPSSTSWNRESNLTWRVSSNIRPVMRRLLYASLHSALLDADIAAARHRTTESGSVAVTRESANPLQSSYRWVLNCRVVSLGAAQRGFLMARALRRHGLAGLAVTGEGTKWHTYPGISEVMLGLSH